MRRGIFPKQIVRWQQKSRALLDIKYIRSVKNPFGYFLDQRAHLSTAGAPFGGLGIIIEGQYLGRSSSRPSVQNKRASLGYHRSNEEQQNVTLEIVRHCSRRMFNSNYFL